MADAHPQPLQLLGGSITGFSQPAAQDDGAPLIVFLHGGGSNAMETLIPGHSQLGLAAENGFSAFALNRPGYLDSPSLGFSGDSESGWFAASAARIDDAIAELWETHGGVSAGIVVHGCSIGGAIALTLAARWSEADARGEARWPLLGVAAGDIGQTPPPAVAERWHRTEVTEFVPDLRVGSADLPTPPAWTLPRGPLPDVPARIPRDELLEVVSGWPRTWRQTLSVISVPVFWRIAEWDNLWEVSDDLFTEFAEAFTAAPHVDAAIALGASHGIMFGPVGDAYNLSLLSFAAYCRALSAVPEILTERRGAVA